MLSDLRSSGSIEQDSTQVWFPRPVWGEPEPQQLVIFTENKDSKWEPAPKAACDPGTICTSRRTGTALPEVTDPILWDRSTGTIQRPGCRPSGPKWMKVWIEEAVVLEAPRLLWFGAETGLSVLVGFSIKHGIPMRVEPVYRPLVIFEKRKGYVRIEVSTLQERL